MKAKNDIRTMMLVELAQDGTILPYLRGLDITFQLNTPTEPSPQYGYVTWDKTVDFKPRKNNNEVDVVMEDGKTITTLYAQENTQLAILECLVTKGTEYKTHPLVQQQIIAESVVPIETRRLRPLK